MILPTKHITVENSLIGVGGLLLPHLSHPTTVSALWEKAREMPPVATYERFTLALDLLYILEAIEFRDGQLRLIQQ